MSGKWGHERHTCIYLLSCWMQREFFDQGSEHMSSSRYKVTSVTLGTFALETANNLLALLNERGPTGVTVACFKHILCSHSHT